MQNYDEYEKKQTQKAKEQQAAYETDRNKARDEQINKINEAYDAAIKPQIDYTQSEIDALPQKYQALYDANAVQELVSRKNVEEAMANMGLTDSGLNRTQQTAISVMRGNSDNAVRLQQQEAARQLEQRLAEIIANATSQKQQTSANIIAQAAADALNNRTSLWNTALSNASSLYNTDYQAELERKRLAEQAEQARLEREAENERAEAEREAQASLYENNNRTDLIKALLSGGYYNSAAEAAAAVDTILRNASQGGAISQGTNKNLTESFDPNFGATPDPRVFGAQYKREIANGMLPELVVNRIVSVYGGNPAYMELAAKQAGVYELLKARYIDD